jgi:hypothetical protein
MIWINVGGGVVDKVKAVELQKLLLVASDALHRTQAVLSASDLHNRAIFARPIAEILGRIHFDLLDEIYARHPELQPPPEPPVIDSELQWHDVTLPAGASEADLDQIIFSVLTSRLQKTAMVIGKAKGLCKERALPIDAEMIGEILGARIQLLAASDRIEAAGDLRYWRHSEIKLKD